MPPWKYTCDDDRDLIVRTRLDTNKLVQAERLFAGVWFPVEYAGLLRVGRKPCDKDVIPQTLATKTYQHTVSDEQMVIGVVRKIPDGDLWVQRANYDPIKRLLLNTEERGPFGSLGAASKFSTSYALDGFTSVSMAVNAEGERVFVPEQVVRQESDDDFAAKFQRRLKGGAV